MRVRNVFFFAVTAAASAGPCWAAEAWAGHAQLVDLSAVLLPALPFAPIYAGRLA